MSEQELPHTCRELATQTAPLSPSVVVITRLELEILLLRAFDEGMNAATGNILKNTSHLAPQARHRDVLVDLLASLTAAVSLLKRGSKKAAPSDRMFDQMLIDYERSIKRARATLEVEATPNG